MTTFQPPRAGERMISVEEAQERVLAEVTLLGTEKVVFTDALGRVLREDIIAPANVPQFPKVQIPSRTSRSPTPAPISSPSNNR